MSFRSKAKQLIVSIKEAFSHLSQRTIKETGTFALGSGLISQLNKYKTTPELLMDGDFVRCIQILANDFSKINFEIQELKEFENGKKYFVSSTSNANWYYLWNVAPSDDLSAQELKKIIVWNLFIYGRAVILIDRDEQGRAKNLIPIFPNYIERKTRDGIPYYELNLSGSTEASAYSGSYDMKSGLYEFSNDDIIWIPFEILDNYQNVEFRTLYSLILNKIQQNQTSQMNALTNDLGVSLFIKLKNASNEQQRASVNQALRDSARFMKESGTFAFVYDDKIEVAGNDKFVQSPISLELRKYIATELASKFGIPASFLGIENPNQSLSQMNRFYLDRALEPLTYNIISKISYSIFGKENKKRITYNTIQFSGLDLSEKVNTISQAINNGIMTPNEGRMWLGLEPHKDGNTLFANAAIQNINTMNQKTEAEINKLNSEAEKNNNEKNSEKNSNDSNLSTYN